MDFIKKGLGLALFVFCHFAQSAPAGAFSVGVLDQGLAFKENGGQVHMIKIKQTPRQLQGLADQVNIYLQRLKNHEGNPEIELDSIYITEFDSTGKMPFVPEKFFTKRSTDYFAAVGDRRIELKSKAGNLVHSFEINQNEAGLRVLANDLNQYIKRMSANGVLTPNFQELAKFTDRKTKFEPQRYFDFAPSKSSNTEHLKQVEKNAQ